MIPLRDSIRAHRFPAVTIGLIAANLAVFLYQYLLVPESTRRIIFLYGLIPREITTGVPLVPHPFPVQVTLFTSMFVHGGFFHVAGNMLYLWIFGNNVEDAMGHARFILFYLLSGLAAAFIQVMAGPNSPIPMVGASGAVSGILGAYLLLYPHARVLTLITLGWFWRLVEIPALIVLGFWIVVQVLNGLLTFNFQGGGVAWFAHIGGFAAGMLLLPFCKRRTVPVRLFRR
ncbi:MAG: rhomboid family intramembrane serine protease [candidate division NC10 bacterium]|nr:rhomboid family intramembrane serine protease [candidate division NC10 bacterium]MBI3080915.1 rhomboid family intramembrane serine protease [candidate division NC10 bacterium]MBI4413937.1 rhomboid family intramembrane serine protease [candidate division NC10 bacterium]